MLRCVKRILYRAVKFFFQAINRPAMSPFASFARPLASLPQLEAGFDHPLEFGARPARAGLHPHTLIARHPAGGATLGVGVGLTVAFFLRGLDALAHPALPPAPDVH